MTNFIQISTTFETKEQARDFAKTILDLRLAACVQINGPIESHYRWKGSLETASEWRCLIKTHTTCTPDLRACLAGHPYDVPEWIVCPIIDGTPEYLDWMRSVIKR